MSQTLTALLQQALRLEGRSFLVYVRDAADPRIGARETQIKEALEQLIRNEEGYFEAILNLLDSYGLHPDLTPSFDMANAGYHYLQLSYLIQIVETKLGEQLDAFRTIYDRVADVDANAASTLQKIARSKQQDLELVQTFHDQAREKHGTSKIEDNRTLGRI